MARILLLHGPNLNLLGQREPDVYGSSTLADYVGLARDRAIELGHVLDDRQTNHEGEFVEEIHRARHERDALIVNAGALTHYAWSIHDALRTFDGPVIELHISQPNAREPWRHTSVVAPAATGSIAGFGPLGYVLAVDAVHRSLA